MNRHIQHHRTALAVDTEVVVVRLSAVLGMLQTAGLAGSAEVNTGLELDMAGTALG